MNNTTAIWINALRNAQKAIRTAILGKGVQITGDLSSYPDAINQLKNPQGEKIINANGNYNIADFEGVAVNVPQIQTESKSISANGTYTAPSGKAWNSVSVNVPASGITPSGTTEINQNGVHNVSQFEYANVSVPVGIFPSGSQNITENGVYNVESLASVNVAVPVGAAVVTGQVSGSGSKVLTIPAAAGKDNLVVVLISTTSSNLSVSTITGGGYVAGSAYLTYKSSSNVMRLSTTASYNKNTGAISYTGSSSYNFSNNTNLKYLYVAW